MTENKTEFNWNVNIKRDLRKPLREISYREDKPMNHVLSDLIEEALNKKNGGCR
jgi:hypothetical protein